MSEPLKLDRLSRIETAVLRIESKINLLAAALAAEDDEEEGPTQDLDGNPMSGQRKEGEPL